MQAPTAPAASKRPSRSSRIFRALLALGLGLVITLLGAELALRLVLSNPGIELGRVGRHFREPSRYSNGSNDDDYWKLLSKLQGPAGLVDMPQADPITGWTCTLVAPGTYASIHENQIRGRRPVLLYGDSFAQTMSLHADRFQAIFERSEFAADHVLLNYGVGGYGVDQIYLLLKHSIDRFAHLDPIVIVSVLVEGDYERSILSFRTWPKPRLEVQGDQLVARGPVQTSVREYLEENPISIRSYLWRLFLHHRSPLLARERALWRGDAQVDAEKQGLNRRILEEIERELSSRKLEHFYLAFHSEYGALKPAPGCDWQERMLKDFCAEAGAPLVDTRTFLSLACGARPELAAQFYGHGEPLYGHHNALGNLVCFDAIRHGLRGEHSEPRPRYVASGNEYGLLDWVAPEQSASTFLGRSATLTTHGSGGEQLVAERSDPAGFLMRADALGATRAQFELTGADKRFSGRLHLVAGPNQRCEKSDLRFFVEIDGAIVLERAVPPESEALDLDLDLQGKRAIAFVVCGDRGGAGCNWIAIADPRFE